MTANDQPTAEHETAQRLIAKIEVPAEAVGLATVLDNISTIVVEGEQLVPNWHNQVPYLWVTNGDLAAFEDAVADDPSVTSIQQIATFDSGALYELDWATEDHGLRVWLRQAEIPMLEAEATGETQTWHLKLRLSTRDKLTDLQNYCEEQGFDFQLLRLYSLATPKMGEYNVSPKQREAFLTAYKMGYFEIPRECQLSDVAEQLGITTRSASERLRCGETNLLTNTLLIGHTDSPDSQM